MFSNTAVLDRIRPQLAIQFLCFCRFYFSFNSLTITGDIYKENQQAYFRLLDTFTGFEFIDFLTNFHPSEIQF